MHTPDGRFHLVFNGELYNFRELRQELESVGVTFRSTGDAEVVLQALSTWGSAALARFNGMFALGHYDEVRCRLLWRVITRKSNRFMLRELRGAVFLRRSSIRS